MTITTSRMGESVNLNAELEIVRSLGLHESDSQSQKLPSEHWFKLAAVIVKYHSDISHLGIMTLAASHGGSRPLHRLPRDPQA